MSSVSQLRSACDLPARPGAMPSISLQALGATGPSNKWPPQRVTEVLIRWMRYHFADPSRIKDDDLKDKVWVDNPSTPILIQSLAAYTPDTANRRPAILVNRLAQTPDPRRAMDDRRAGGCGAGNAELAYSQLWVGQHVLHCIGGREGEDEALGGEVTQELAAFVHTLREPLCLTRLMVLGTQTRTKLEEYKETWTVPVGIGYAYWYSFRIVPLDAPDLGGVQTTIQGG